MFFIILHEQKVSQCVQESLQNQHPDMKISSTLLIKPHRAQNQLRRGLCTPEGWAGGGMSSAGLKEGPTHILAAAAAARF